MATTKKEKTTNIKNLSLRTPMPSGDGEGSFENVLYNSDWLSANTHWTMDTTEGIPVYDTEGSYSRSFTKWMTAIDYEVMDVEYRLTAVEDIANSLTALMELSDGSKVAVLTGFIELSDQISGLADTYYDALTSYAAIDGGSEFLEDILPQSENIAALSNLMSAVGFEFAEGGEFDFSGCYYVPHDSTDLYNSIFSMDTELYTIIGGTYGDITVPSADNLVSAVNKIYDDLVTLSGFCEIMVEPRETPETGYLTTYDIYQGGDVVGSINIPKDFLVKSAALSTVTSANVPYSGAQVGDKYIDFVINVKEGTATNDHVYLPVNDLVDVYTAQQNATQVQLAIDSNNVISAAIVAGSIGTTELSANAVTSAKIADDAVTTAKILSGAVTSAKIADDAVTSAKILSAAVTTDKILSGAVTSEKLGDASVTTSKLGWLDYITFTDQTTDTTSENYGRFWKIQIVEGRLQVVNEGV